MVKANSRNSRLAALLIALAGVSPALAQEPGVPSKEALARKTALKLAGLATFVATSCRDLKLDTERFKAAVSALGVPPQNLEEKTTQFAYLEYTMAYKKDIKANCARAKTEFGPGGKTLPNLFAVVDVPVAPPASPKTPDKAPEKAPSASPAVPEGKKP